MAASTATNIPTTKSGVIELQKQLNANGANLKVDGILGPQTAKALQTQLNSQGANLKVDGIVGKQTAAAMNTYSLPGYGPAPSYSQPQPGSYTGYSQQAKGITQAPAFGTGFSSALKSPVQQALGNHSQGAPVYAPTAAVPASVSVPKPGSYLQELQLLQANKASKATPAPVMYSAAPRASSAARTAHGQSLPYENMTEDQVKWLQGTLGVTADGIWGSKSQAAWERYQLQNPQPQGKLSIEPAPAKALTGYGLPYAGMTNDELKKMQKQLGVTADGIWGPKTQAAYEKAMAEQGLPLGHASAQAPARTVNGQALPYADMTSSEVKQVQRALGVTADGIWGRKTQAAWEAAMKDGKLTDSGAIKFLAQKEPSKPEEVKYLDSYRELPPEEVLARLIYSEAYGDEDEMRAVAQTVINRAKGDINKIMGEMVAKGAYSGIKPGAKGANPAGFSSWDANQYAKAYALATELIETWERNSDYLADSVIGAKTQYKGQSMFMNFRYNPENIRDQIYISSEDGGYVTVYKLVDNYRVNRTVFFERGTKLATVKVGSAEYNALFKEYEQLHYTAEQWAKAHPEPDESGWSPPVGTVY